MAAALSGVIRYRWLTEGQLHDKRPVYHLYRFPAGKKGPRPLCGSRASFEFEDDVGHLKCLECRKRQFRYEAPGIGEYMMRKREP